MSVHSSTLHKLLRERFAPDAPDVPHAPAPDAPAIRLIDDEEIERFRKSLTDRVAVKGEIAITDPNLGWRHHAQPTHRAVCGLEVQDSTSRAWRSAIHVTFEAVLATGSLHVRATYDVKRPSYPVASLDQIGAFVADAREAVARAQVREAKRNKLRKLRMHAVMARIQRIASEDGFAFATESEGNRIKLHVRLGARSLLELRFTQQGFEASIEAARPLIAAARVCHEKGVAFGVRAGSSWKLRGLVWSDAKK